MKCRHCMAPLEKVFLDLGSAPPSNAYKTKEDLLLPETTYPLRLLVCTDCWLVQTEDHAKAEELFDAEYAYFSSTSKSWMEHASSYCDMIQQRLSLADGSFVIEVASNDGYLLKNFSQKGVSCLGIEPTDSTADAAEKLGIPVLREFFGESLAKKLSNEGKQADLVIGNNVYAHVPDINDFTCGLKAVLKPSGTITLEFPHLMRLIEHNQFDTVYHEHFSYLSLYTVVHIFKAAGLRIWDVEELTTHGGSLRIYGCHAEDLRSTTTTVHEILAEEVQCGLQILTTYQSFQAKADKVKGDLLDFLIAQKQEGKTVIAYGAAAKGSTILNYAGITPELLPVVCDAAPSKNGKFLPGSQIPILDPDYIFEQKPDFILILPWNIAEEIMSQFEIAREWGAKFVTAVPRLISV